MAILSAITSVIWLFAAIFMGLAASNSGNGLMWAAAALDFGLALFYLFMTIVYLQ